MGSVDGIMSYELDGYVRIRLGVAFFGNDSKLLLSSLWRFSGVYRVMDGLGTVGYT
jgi:hypothetical protein